MSPAARLYARKNGSTFIVARTNSGRYAIVNTIALFPTHGTFATRRAAVAAGMDQVEL